MKKNDGKPRKGISLKLQIIFSLLGLIIMIIVICLVMNTFFLENYYLRNKESVIKSAYSLINDSFNNGDYDSEEMSIEIRRVCATYNISMVVMDETTNTLLASQDETDLLVMQLFSNMFGDRIDEGAQPEPENAENTDDGSTPGGDKTAAGSDGAGAAPKDDKNKLSIIEQTSDYTLQIGSDIRSGDRYLEMWGVLDCGNIFMMRCALDSISDSISISNRFLIFTGIIIAVLGVLVSLLVSRKISKPILELTEISNRMKDLDFDAKYTGRAGNEIGTLGENINELSETLEHTISELKSANAQLERDLEQKVKIDDMRKEFISNVSHELKTPIALIQGYAEGLQDCVNDDEESRNFYCDVIVDEASKMNTMVKKLLTLNQLEFGKETINMERFDIVALIRGYLQSASILIEQHEAVVHMDEYPPIEVWGDQIEAEEVFTNYFTNALNHLNGEKKIDITLRQMDPDHVRISVFNTGDPIPEDSIDRVWDKFYKVDKARTREYGGSGVGLSIVKAIQESMNQAYGVINYNNGVEFYFEMDTSVR